MPAAAFEATVDAPAEIVPAMLLADAVELAIELLAAAALLDAWLLPIPIWATTQCFAAIKAPTGANAAMATS